MAIKLTPIQCPQCGQSLSFRPGQRKIICTSCGTNILVEDDHQHIVRHIIESEPVLAYDTKRINSQQNVPDILSQMDPDQVMRKATKVWLIIVACFVIPMLLFGNTGLGGFFVLFGLPIILLSAMIIFPIAAGKKEEMIKKIEEERKRQEIERKKEREEFERREKERRRKEEELKRQERIRMLIEEGAVFFPEVVFPYENKDYRAVRNIIAASGFTNISCISLNDGNRLGIQLLRYKQNRVEKITVDGKTVAKGAEPYFPDVPVIITYHGN